MQPLRQELRDRQRRIGIGAQELRGIGERIDRRVIDGAHRRGVGCVEQNRHFPEDRAAITHQRNACLAAQDLDRAGVENIYATRLRPLGHKDGAGGYGRLLRRCTARQNARHPQAPLTPTISPRRIAKDGAAKPAPIREAR